MPNEVLIVGGGPAGLMAAAAAARAGARATLLERNEKAGMKLRITGKGRCNVTNRAAALEELIAKVSGNGRFLFGAFSRFMPADTMELFESLGVPLKIERGGRVFPQSDNAHDIADALVNYARKCGAQLRFGARITNISRAGEQFELRAQNGESFRADAVILATGGMSYPKTGSTGDGYDLARQLGHSVTPLRPSLVPLECHEGFCEKLMGLSLRNTGLEVFDRKAGRVIYKDFGELLFTHFGVSGPMALSASARMREMEPERYELWLDLKPALRPEQLDARILRDFNEAPNKNYINALDALLPKSLAPVFARLSGVPAGLRVNQVTKEQRQRIAALFKKFPLTVTGFRPIEEAIVTAGGVNVQEIDPAAMQSKLCPGLFFAGELLDADACTGGYNLQIAFSTGRLAGNAASNK